MNVTFVFQVERRIIDYIFHSSHLTVSRVLDIPADPGALLC